MANTCNWNIPYRHEERSPETMASSKRSSVDSIGYIFKLYLRIRSTIIIHNQHCSVKKRVYNTEIIKRTVRHPLKQAHDKAQQEAQTNPPPLKTH